ncbi:SNF2 family N-terminal domain-containing protein, partial [Blyttiomyces helicus]
FMIAAPSSTLGHWQREFAKWAPALNVVVYGGTAAERKMSREYELFEPGGGSVLQCDVVVTSYELLQKESGLFRSVPFELLVCDEGHRLKNDEAKTFGAIRRDLKVAHKILLTGTPLQNNIRELFNLLSFLDPEEFDDYPAWEK